MQTTRCIGTKTSTTYWQVDSFENYSKEENALANNLCGTATTSPATWTVSSYDMEGNAVDQNFHTSVRATGSSNTIRTRTSVSHLNRRQYLKIYKGEEISS
jgi:hypothetical protein